ncbi:sugar transferase [Plantibacter sp. YIM 135347]|uniref:sugar transferase n=1 Tax=Plantibacter sp. YIM 135347 TaxID=3423919 RepID=UPI003D32BA24
MTATLQPLVRRWPETDGPKPRIHRVPTSMLLPVALAPGAPVAVLAPVETVHGERAPEPMTAATALAAVELPRRSVKRGFDVVASAIGLLLLSPVLLVVALLVKLDSRGSVLFRQTRVGLNGEHFSILKFRTMEQNAEARVAELQAFNEGAGPLFKMKADPRVTRVGRILRKLSIDELPQLVNVLRGDMSLVGPRPGLPSEVAAYEPHAHRRLLVLPGITGLWQVSGRSDLSWEAGLELDLDYVDDCSFGRDLVILARTVPRVLGSSGAY